MESPHLQVNDNAPQMAIPAPSTLGLNQVTSSMWVPPFSPALLGISMDSKEAAELYNLAVECGNMGTQLTHEFQCLTGQEAMD